MAGYIFIGLVVVLVYFIVSGYNRLVRLKNNVKAAWSNIDVLLKQRHDELPKLVTTCKQYMQFEQETLEKVTAARACVAQAQRRQDMSALGAGEAMMSAGLGQLFALVENYPELKANESFRQLQARISSLENAIADRREFYNDSVNINNIVVEEFPSNIIASFFTFKTATLFEVAEGELADPDLQVLFN